MGEKCYHFTLCASFLCLFIFIALSSRIITSRPATYLEERSQLKTSRPARYINHPCYVQTTSGPVAGQLLDLDGRSVCQFIGIPYAQAPVGKLRFLKPKSLESEWKGVVHNEAFRPSCIQTFPNWAKHMMRPATNETSEDCLYLNIWQPMSEEITPRKSIVMWIHGGGYQFGSGTLDETNGTALAAYSDVIVVTINYRLNAFGFLNLQSDSVPGNMGLYDQASGLDWLYKNAGRFNGNHHSITLWGQGMGAISISAHLVSPLTRNKFRRAIMQTGSIFTMPMMYSEYEKVAGDLIRLLECDVRSEGEKDDPEDEDKSNAGKYEYDDDLLGEVEKEEVSPDQEEGHSSHQGSSSERDEDEDINKLNKLNDVDDNLLKCLQQVPTDKIAQAVHQINSVNPISFMFSPYESFFNNTSPSEIKSDLRAYLSTTVKDFLFGFNSHEGSLLLNSLDPQMFPDNATPYFNTSETAREILLNIFSSKLNVPRPILRTGIDAAFSGIDRHDNDSLINAMIDFTGNNMFVCPTLAYADEVSSRNITEEENVHLFLFNGRSEYNQLPKWFGTIHNEEVPMMFGYPSRYPGSFSSDTVQLSHKLMDTVAIFAKSG